MEDANQSARDNETNSGDEDDHKAKETVKAQIKSIEQFVKSTTKDAFEDGT